MLDFAMTSWTTRTVLLAPIAAAAIVTAPSHAQSPRPTAALQLSIPAGDLGAALSAFSRATDIQVVVDPALIAGKRSSGVSGSFAADEALTRLLDSSGASFAGRLSYSWQGDVLQEVGTNGLSSANDKAFGSLDADVSYRLNEQITVFAQGINITDEAQLQFVRDDWFSGYTRYGRTLMLGMRAKY